MDNENAKLAAEMFDHFCSVTTMRQIMGLYRNMMDAVGLRPGPLNDFYPKLKAKIRNWKAQALWKKFDTRAGHRVYNKGTACNGIRVLVIGAGPCGLRTAIEAQLLGAKVVVVEKRDRISRNNVLHLWPFVITDLRNLGAKKFYGKFCAGSIDHISIRQLQCILLKVALLLGVEVHEGVSFVKLIEPKDGCGWRAQVSPEDHAVSHYEFDALIGADGKRNTLEGFVRKEFRGKLAIAITANFINKRTEAEAKVEEISGVAFIFNQSFFKELYYRTGIDLENIVYYKDETHYFVMTAKKMSLIDKGVIIQDSADPAELLSPSNVNTDKLLDYAREAAEFSTKYQMPNLEFAVNHYGKPDVAMFDFTSMFQAENSSRVCVRKNYRLLQCLVGDSLLEPFWPTGSGCARGFLSSMDAAYAIKLFANPRNSCLAVLAQRESLYRLLGQTTPENLNRDIMAYTLDPSTRYPNLNKTLVQVQQVEMLLDADDETIYQQTFMDTNAISAVPDAPVRRKRRTGDTTPLGMVLLRWIKSQLKAYEFANNLTEVAQCFTHGRVLCALIHRYRPELLDFSTLGDLPAEQCNAKAFDILENDLGIPRVMQASESVNIEKIESKLWLNYLEQICELFRGEIPHVKHPKLDFAELKEKQRSNIPDFSNLVKSSGKRNVVEVEAINRRITLDEERNKNRSRRLNYEQMQAVQAAEGSRRAKKRRSHEKFANVEEQKKRLQDIQNNRMERQSKRRLERARQTENFYKSLHMLQFNSFLRDTDSSTPFEDYSLYVYRQQAPDFNDRVKDLERKLLYPDRERGFYSALARGAPDEKFSNRIKSMESKIVGKNAGLGDKKPKDLLRAIGKIESDDWNVREIEKKIEQSKKAEVGKSREKVPKWSREQFLARQSKMSKPIDRQSSIDEKFKEIDMTIKSLDKQLKEGHNLDRGERGRNKVASIAGQFVKKTPGTSAEEKQGSKSLMNSKLGLVLTSQGVSEICHFCKQKVYLMEKIAAEGLVLHRSCLKCHHCHTNLRLGGYAFDRDSPDGLFYCNQHFKLPPKPYKPVTKRQPSHPKHEEIAAKTSRISPEKVSRAENIVAMDLLDRGQTPERIEFENTDAMSDGERSLNNIIDENEWTDRNFGTGTDETDSDLSSSDSSDSETDSDMYEEANDSPIGAETLQLATDWIGKQRICSLQDSDGDEFYDSSEDDDVDTQTEGEELARAREIRMQEVKLMPPVYPATDTETEVQSDSESSSVEIEPNSATEISTDSEFDHDPIAKTPPQIVIDDTYIKRPTRVHIRQGMIANGLNRQVAKENTAESKVSDLSKIELDIKPLVQVDPSVLASTNRIPLKNPRPGDYLLNKAPSTEGIASKRSLELKKRYLLGESGSTGLMKSGSTSVLDSTFKNFHSNISQCQKLLNRGGADISPTMQMFLKQQTNRLSGTKEEKKEVESNLINEKINVYGMNNNLKEIAEKRIDEEHVMPTETINTALVENKLKDFISCSKSNDPADVPIIDLTNVDLPEEMIRANQEFIEKLECSDDVENNKVIEVIDLTIEASPPVKFDLGARCEKRDEQVVPESISSIKSKIEADKSAIDSLLRQRDMCDVQETTIQVPVLNSWEPKKKPRSDSDVESDSLSNSSSTSSLEEIPHYILDSTTSPDTQINERFVPRLEVRDTTGELMQIDSLMIVDGKYIGDPEDLQLLEKLPEIPAASAEVSQPSSANECDISCNSETKRQNDVGRGISEVLRRNDSFKFDARNKSKIESLKHLPLNLETKESQSDLESPIVDRDKTPTANLAPGFIGQSDSETEITGQVLTETELSDWTADDAVSENFVDIEFALNSNKGTIKRNKKAKKKAVPPEPLVHHQQLSDGDLETNIMKSFDIDNIEFMDTGSDGCVETYSTTNKGMLRNRGYVEFVDQIPEHGNTNRYCPSYRSDTGYSSSSRINLGYAKPESSSSREIPGIDYIEQGACVLSSSSEGELKTPVNEVTKSVFTDTSSSQVIKTQDSEQHSSSVNEIEDDSLVLITSQTNTTEDSEALTVVTSPLDSADKNAVEQSFGEAVKAISKDEYRNTPEEMSYEDYVRKLQMKISQISNSRDSIDVKKSKRRSSKGEGDASASEIPSPTSFTPKLSIFDDKIKEPPTLTKKLEEITKERAKQKDLIHDLVMDKLQTKKQLNAEKRLNRSRTRQMGCTSGSLALSGLKSFDIPHCHPVPGEKRTTPSKVFEPLQSPSKVLETAISSAEKLKDRPLSENVDSKFGAGIVLPVSPKKLTKTQSFCGYSSRLVSAENDLIAESFKTPIPPPRSGRRIDDKTLAHSDKLRQEARARARLMSNEDLGLSPEEKMQMLRKRYQLDADLDTPNKSDDAKVREQKLMASKSVSDISTANSFVAFDKSIDGSDGKSTPRKFFKGAEFTSDSNLVSDVGVVNDKTPNGGKKESPKRLSDRRSRSKDPERRKSIIQTVSDFFHKKKDSKDAINQINKDKADGVFGLFKLSSKHKEKSKSCFDVRELMIFCEKENSPSYSERSKSEDCLKADWRNRRSEDELTPPPIPPLPLNYQRSDDESTSVAENRELKRLKAVSKASRQAELKRLRIAQEIQREQEEIEVQIKELEARGVIIEKVLRGEGSFGEYFNANDPNGSSDEKYLKELLEIWRKITQLKKRDQELGIREQELKLEHRHAQLKEQLNMRLSCSKLDKSSADVAAEGAILNEMLEIVAKRAALRPTDGLPTADEVSPEDEIVVAPTLKWGPVLVVFSLLYACILWFAYSRC
ncbi:F-actin-monooxygenase Mical isoform X1 [Lutzomyia longipalpis]|uniref:F-actin-monooxygenase Mical isoform X1 n=1 Tax=Lutzomyia longipalpis TaxID=7200 RepID=UPI002483CF6A|nr:F-actin-monooxygenase Mical isoform X1 [Lutzomyia longipalpis]